MLNTTASAPLPEISVVVLTRDRLAILQKCLSALRDQIDPNHDEILVVDTGSKDGTVEWLNRQGPTVRYVSYESTEFDFARARHFAVGNAQKPFVAFTDDDAIPDPLWLPSIRHELMEAPMAGGPALAGEELPVRWWWSPEISWLVGNSPPGTVTGNRENYPATSSMAFSKELYLELTDKLADPSTSGGLYVSGREDAELWRQARITGVRAANDYRACVFHYPGYNRFAMGLILKRAYHDGWAGWLRRPSAAGMRDMPWELAVARWDLLVSIGRNPLNFRRHFARLCWLVRQSGRRKAMVKQPFDGLRVSTETEFEQFVMVGKQRLGRPYFQWKGEVRGKSPFPPAAPGTIYVSADCYLGDTVLLRRPLSALRKTFPAARIIVTARYPDLLVDIPGLIILPAGVDPESGGTSVDVAVVPYYHFGNVQAWRKSLSHKAVTFDCDTGFPGRRDYLLARKTIRKDLELHELENLFRLFSLWPLSGIDEEVVLQPPPGAREVVAKLLPPEWERSGYVCVQFGAGMSDKEWPLDRWIPFLKEFMETCSLPIVIIGGENWSEAGEIAVRELGDERVLSVAGCPFNALWSVIAYSKLLIGACSGPKHLAFAMHVPTFTLYAATEPERWGATERTELHAYVNAVHDRLTGTELQGLSAHHRILLLDPVVTANAALVHARTFGLC